MQCFSPYLLKQDGEIIPVRCGNCVSCVMQKAREWSLRCVHELKYHKTGCFITLTYNNDCLPDDGKLNYSDFQLFMKRLRKRYGKGIRYFVVGEYGDKGNRPHYHALLYGIDFSDDRILIRSNRSSPLFRSHILEKLWQKGFCSIGNITNRSANYCARYTMKKLTVLYDNEYNDYRPKLHCSKGIGRKWCEQWISDVLKRKYIVYDNQKYGVPRYYLKLASDDPNIDIDPKLITDFQIWRLKIVKENDQKMLDMYGKGYYSRLRSIEECLLYRVNNNLKRCLHESSNVFNL